MTSTWSRSRKDVSGLFMAWRAAKDSICLVARSDAFFLGVGCRLGANQRGKQRAVCGDPVAAVVPLLAIPLDDLGRDRVALVVIEAGPQRADQSLRTELIQALLIDVQVLKCPSAFFGVEGPVAKFLVTDTQGLDEDDGFNHAVVVIDRAELALVLQVALADVQDLLLQRLQHRELGSGREH